MNSQASTQQSFKADYALLQLSEKSDWPAARTNYRRLVHVWHPDKFAQRPREKAHAQQQFIELTKSYNALRNYHRIHDKLPFQAVKQQSSATASDIRGKQQSSAGVSGNRRGPESDIYESTVFGRSANAARTSPGNRLWLAPVAIVMLATIVFFYLQDSKATKATQAQAQQIVKQAPQSEFLTDDKKIRKTQAREAFLHAPR